MGTRRFWAVYAALLILALLPILLPYIPPFYDALNHLARARILSVYDGDSFYRGIYKTNWRIIPNLALDVSLVALCRVAPPIIALKIYLASTVVLLTGGFAGLHRAIYGRFSPPALGGFLLIFTLSMFMGLMNFLFGIGVGFVFCAAYLSLRSRLAPLRLAVSAVLALLVFFSHLLAFLFALLFLAVIAGLPPTDGNDRERHRLGRRGPDWRALAEVALIALPGFLLYFILSPTRGEVDVFFWRAPLDKLAAFGSLFRSGSNPVDFVAIPLLYFGVVALLVAAWPRRPRFTLPLLLATTAIFFVAPFGSKTTQILDSRLPIFILAAALLALPPDVLSALPRSRRALVGAVAVGVAFAVQIFGLTVAYLGVQGDYRALASLYERLPDRASVFAAAYTPIYDRQYGPLVKRHTNSSGLATVVGENYSSNIFTIPSQQPLVFRPKTHPLSLLVQVGGDPERALAAPALIEVMLRATGHEGEEVYLQFATLPHSVPKPMPGCDLLLARPGIGVYRIRAGWR